MSELNGVANIRSLNELTDGELDELFEDTPLSVTCLEGKVSFNLVSPTEEAMQRICEDVLAAAESEDENRSIAIMCVQMYGQEFVEGHRLTNEKWKVLLRKSSSAERHTIFRYIEGCIVGWLGVSDADTAEEQSKKK